MARTHLQLLLTATAMKVVGVIAWLRGKPVGEGWWKPGDLARLVPHPLSRQTVLCQEITDPAASMMTRAAPDARVDGLAVQMKA